MSLKINLRIDQGTTFSKTIELADDNGDPLNVTGFSCQSGIKSNYESPCALSFNTALSNGSVILSLDANTTNRLIQPRYLYDVIIIDPSNNVKRVAEGTIYIDPSVTTITNTNFNYVLYVVNTQNNMFKGDIIYQSNGTANVTGIITSVSVPIGSGDISVSANVSNLTIVEVSNTNGLFSANSGYLVYDANTLANGSIINITRSFEDQSFPATISPYNINLDGGTF